MPGDFFDCHNWGVVPLASGEQRPWMLLNPVQRRITPKQGFLLPQMSGGPRLRNCFRQNFQHSSCLHPSGVSRRIWCLIPELFKALRHESAGLSLVPPCKGTYLLIVPIQERSTFQTTVLHSGPLLSPVPFSLFP